MRTRYLILVLGLTSAAHAAPTCHTSDALFGSLGAERCAPIDGRIATKMPPSCADGSYAPDGHTRTDADGDPKPHLGADLLSTIDSDVFAPAEGVVLDVRNFPKTSGWQINIRHADRRVTRYFHLSAAIVRANESVSLGEKIGLSGMTGNARATSCPHLHFELRSDAYPKTENLVGWDYGPPMDPIAWLAMAPPLAQTSQKTTQ
jgi:murein DD-endopeptidase MepM/ murein hydrolase activator NlpD